MKQDRMRNVLVCIVLVSHETLA